jgi:hypothetical protein
VKRLFSVFSNRPCDFPPKQHTQADETFIITQWKLAVEGRNPNMIDFTQAGGETGGPAPNQKAC